MKEAELKEIGLKQSRRETLADWLTWRVMDLCTAIKRACQPNGSNACLLWPLLGFGMTLGLAGAGRAQAVYVPPVTQSAQVVYASKAGAKLNSNLQAGGGTDDTAAIQAILNKASTGKPVHLIVDGPALVTGLIYYGNTQISGIAGGGFYLKTQSNKPVLCNAHKTTGTIVDKVIALDHLLINGNGLPGSDGNVDTNQLHDTSANGWIVPIGAFGVDGLTIRDVTVINGRTFGLHLANVFHVRMDNVRVNQNETSGINYDGIHFNGPAAFIQLSNLTVNAWDDALAFNADDSGTGAVEAHPFGESWLGVGPITDVTVDGLTLDNSLFGLRLLSGTSRIDRISVSNIKGTCFDYCAVMNTFGQGPGNFGSITLDGIDVLGGAPAYNYSPGLINVGGNFDSLTLRNIKRISPINTRPTLDVAAGSTIKLLNVQGASLLDSVAGAAGLNHVTNEGTIRQLNMTGINWMVTNAGGGSLLANFGTVGDWLLSGSTVPAGTLLSGNAPGVQHGDSFATASAAIPALAKSTFLAADNTDLIATYTPLTGPHWQTVAGSWQIQNNRAVPSGTLASNNWVTTVPVTGAAKVTARWVQGANSEVSQIWLRDSDVNNAGAIVLVNTSSGQMQAYNATAGNYALISQANIPTSGAGVTHSLVVTFSGTSYNAVLDGGSPFTFTSSVLPSATGYGIATSGTPSGTAYTYFEVD